MATPLPEPHIAGDYLSDLGAQLPRLNDEGRCSNVGGDYEALPEACKCWGAHRYPQLFHM
jgi:hypothetical protein